MLFVVVLSTIGTFKLFAEPYVITGGGPTNSTITIVQYIYRQAFVNFNLGYAARSQLCLWQLSACFLLSRSRSEVRTDARTTA